MDNSLQFRQSVVKFNNDFEFFFSNFQELIYNKKFDEQSFEWAFHYFSEDRNQVLSKFASFSKDYTDFSDFYWSNFFQFFGPSFDRFFSEFFVFFTEYKANKASFDAFAQSHPEKFQLFFDVLEDFFTQFDAFLARFANVEQTGFYWRYQAFKKNFFEFKSFFSF